MEFKFEVGDKVGGVWGVGEITDIQNAHEDAYTIECNYGYDVVLVKTGDNKYKPLDNELPQIWPLDADGVNRFPREPDIDHEKEFWFGRRVMARKGGGGDWIRVVATGLVPFGFRGVDFNDVRGTYYMEFFDEVKYEEWADE